MIENTLEQEAIIMGSYILGKAINTESIDFYVNSYASAPMVGSEKEQQLLNKVLKQGWKLPYYDAALSLSNQEHFIKRRLLRMFAILETRPEYADHFVGREFGKLYLIKIAWYGIRAIYKAIVGWWMILLKI
jgi:hypothetical protein